MAKHTPAPWKQFVPHGQLNIFITGGKGSSHLATVAVSDCTFDRDEDEANARLIAAAPDLLAALQAFADCHDSENGLISNAIYGQAVEAITKATA